MSRRWAVVAWIAAATVAAGCGGGDDGGAAEPTATLAVISTRIETALGTGAFRGATEGQALSVGDRVRTDDTGFAEITYTDGSWMRIDNNATARIRSLVARDAVRRVRVSIDTGDAWNRVGKLSAGEDAYVLETPVATAAVRGTAFAAQCTGRTSCRFSVVEGTVTVTPLDGEAVLLTAGDVLTVTADERPRRDAPGVPELLDDEFIATNVELDTAKDPRLRSPTTFGEDEAATFTGTWSLETTVIDGNASIPEGQTGTSSFTITADCDDDGCVMQSAELGGQASRDGDGVRFQGSVEPAGSCAAVPTIRTLDAFLIVLRPAGTGRLTGRNEQRTIDARGCPNVILDPIVVDWEATRRP